MPEPEETQSTVDPTPEQKAEILGETVTPSETPAEEKPAAEKADTGEPSKTPPEVPPEKKDETVAKPPEGEKPVTEQAVKTFTSEQVQEIIKERLERFGKKHEETIQQLTERLQTLEKGPSQSTVSIEERDLGELLHDPQWKGWNLESLKAQGYEAQHSFALGRIKERADAEQAAQTRTAAEEERQRQTAFDTEIDELRKMDTSYFNPDGTVKGSAKFEELYTWGAKNGVYNLVAAHTLKNFNAVMEKAKKDAVDAHIKEVTKDSSLKRASTTESATTSTSIEGMDDTALQNAFLSASGDRRQEVRKALVSRGLL